jgi:predicted Fe-Mo cluster-binding NifX family protein
MEFLVAVATDDGKKIVERHFGDAQYYDVYRIAKQEIVFVERIENTTEAERQHADPVKAKGITQLLKQKGVQVLVSKNFGPNILRIKTKFVCVRIKKEQVEEIVQEIQNHLETIYYEWLLEDKRNFLKL